MFTNYIHHSAIEANTQDMYEGFLFST